MKTKPTLPPLLQVIQGLPGSTHSNRSLTPFGLWLPKRSVVDGLHQQRAIQLLDAPRIQGGMSVGEGGCGRGSACPGGALSRSGATLDFVNQCDTCPQFHAHTCHSDIKVMSMDVQQSNLPAEVRHALKFHAWQPYRRMMVKLESNRWQVDERSYFSIGRMHTGSHGTHRMGGQM